MLVLSPTGLEALEARAALPLQLPELSPPAENVAAGWQARTERSDTVQETLALFNQGLNPAQIAARRGLAERTIYDHLARLIGDDRLDLGRVVPPEIEAEVLRAVESTGSAARLGPLKAALPQKITFEQIKCVLAAHQELPRGEEASVVEKSVTQRIVALANISDIPRAGGGPVANRPAPSAPSPAADAVIIESVAKLNGALGRTGLAQFLTGSRADWLRTFTGHENYGQLAHLSQRAVLDVIDALIADGRLLTTGGFRPKVRLPEPAPGDHPEKSDQKSDRADGIETGQVTAPPAQTPADADSPPAVFETLRACLTVVADLEGLLTPHGLALLLTAAPGDVAPFSDHDLAGSLHGVITTQALEDRIEEAIQTGQLVRGRQGRLLAGPGFDKSAKI